VEKKKEKTRGPNPQGGEKRGITSFPPPPPSF